MTIDDAAFGRRRRYWSCGLAVALVSFGALDSVSTEIALSADGAYEANPLARAAQEALGAAWALPKMAVHGALAALALAAPSKETLVALSLLAALTLVASLNNLLVHHELLTAAAADAALLMLRAALALG